MAESLAPDGFLQVGDLFLETRFLDGEPGRPVLVLLHEGLGCVSAWRDFPARLSECTGCPVLVYSRAGYGRSSPVPLPRPLTYMHDEASGVLPHVIDALGGRPHVLVGHSDGASIAILYAGADPRPGLRGLVLMAPHVFVEDISIRGIEAARQAWQTTDLRDRLRRYHGDNVDVAFTGWNDAWLDPGFRSWDITSSLPGLRVPALVIQGRDDDYGTLAQVEAISRQRGVSVDTLILDNCGHAPQKDQTAAVLTAIEDFTGRI
jgi:pimeloyl-ACP methyl ester carboxylesterase